MVLTGDIITKENVQSDAFFSTYEGKYNIMDNLDRKSEPIVHARPEIYNSEYVYVTVVLRGTLNLVVGGVDVQLKQHEMLAIMPCLGIEVKESNCQFFCYLIKSYISSGIYGRTGIGKEKSYIYAFNFTHVHIGPDVTDVLLQMYLRLKEEHARPDYRMKEITLRNIHTCILAKEASLITPSDKIMHVKNTRQFGFFRDFMALLRDTHQKERSVQYYANKMNITPKYLSAIVLNFVGMTASQVIDQYVAYAIKQKLYTNEHNIKSISKEFNFPSQSFFGRYFKRITGMSPNEYIKKHNIKSINFDQSKDDEEEA